MSRKPGTPEVLERAGALTRPALRAAVDRLAPGLAVPARYHFGWTDAQGRPITGGGHGKGVRPALALLSAEAVGSPPEVGLPGAVAVELVHNFSLVHDDIVDDDARRRHRATMWKVFGVGDAIIVGDALMGLALEVLLDEPTAARTAAAADLTRATMAMIAGQHLDMSFHPTDRVPLERCWEMVSLKTGAILAHASAVGAILAGAPAPTIEALRVFGEQLGLGFQAVDDLLGIWGDPAVTGKPAGSDLREKKMSIPVTFALGSGTGAGERLAHLYAKEHLDGADIASAAALVEEAGGRSATFAAARERLDRATDVLSSAEIDAGTARELADLAGFILDREF